jgi:hypothetical protein
VAFIERNIYIVHSNKSEKQEEHLRRDVKNKFKPPPSKQQQFWILKIYTYTYTYIWNLNGTMDIIKTGSKSKDLNILEKYDGCKISKDKLHMNDTYIDTSNPIFDTLHELYTR